MAAKNHAGMKGKKFSLRDVATRENKLSKTNFNPPCFLQPCQGDVLFKEVTAIRIDPYKETADINTTNNNWPEIELPSRFKVFKKHKVDAGVNPMQKAKKKGRIVKRTYFLIRKHRGEGSG